LAEDKRGVMKDVVGGAVVGGRLPSGSEPREVGIVAKH
jgi:hypothetical protein